jgi:hypothetical protein
MKTIEQLLVEDAAARIADDGFSARVLSALPRPAARRSPWWKPALILGSTALGCLLAALFAPAGASVFQGVLDLASSHYLTPGAMFVAGTALTLAVAGAVLAADA